MSTQPPVRPASLARRRRAGVATAALVALVLAVVPGQMAVAAPADGTVRTFDNEPLGAPPADCRIIGDWPAAVISDSGFD